MSVNAISSSSQVATASTQPVAPPSPDRQVQKDINDVAKALGADNLPAAKEAVSKLQDNLQNIGSGPNGQQNGQNQISNAVKALSETLKTGNVASAKEAFAVVQQAQQEKIDKKNSESTRESASKVIAPATDKSSVGGNIDTKA